MLYVSVNVLFDSSKGIYLVKPALMIAWNAILLEIACCVTALLIIEFSTPHHKDVCLYQATLMLE